MDRADVERAFDEGQRAWPRLSLELQQFRRHLRRVLGDAPSWDWRAHAAELYLTGACAAGDPLAHEAFERVYFPDVEAVIERVDADRGFVAAVLSSLRARLFTGDGRVFVHGARGFGVGDQVEGRFLAAQLVERERGHVQAAGQLHEVLGRHRMLPASSKIGMYMSTTTPPIATPRNAISTGSKARVNHST